MTAEQLNFQFCDWCSAQYRHMEAKRKFKRTMKKPAGGKEAVFWGGGGERDVRVMQSFFE